MKKCDEVLDNLPAYIDKALTPDEQAEIEAHISQCAGCRFEARNQQEIRRHLRSFVQRQRLPSPSSKIWSNARRGFNRQDGHITRQYQMRFGLAGACLLLVFFRLAWARFNAPQIFPVQEALQDFLNIKQGRIMPDFPSSDPDSASAWLRKELHASIPPMNLSLSQCRLVGAYKVRLNGNDAGLLLYREHANLIGLFIAPRMSQFGNIPEENIDGNPYHFQKNASGLALYGWGNEKAGFGVVGRSSEDIHTTLMNAYEQSSATSH